MTWSERTNCGIDNVYMYACRQASVLCTLQTCTKMLNQAVHKYRCSLFCDFSPLIDELLNGIVHGPILLHSAKKSRQTNQTKISDSCSCILAAVSAQSQAVLAVPAATGEYSLVVLHATVMVFLH